MGKRLARMGVWSNNEVAGECEATALTLQKKGSGVGSVVASGKARGGGGVGGIIMGRLGLGGEVGGLAGQSLGIHWAIRLGTCSKQLPFSLVIPLQLR